VATKCLDWIVDFDWIRRSLAEMGAKRLVHKAYLERLHDRQIEEGTEIVHQWMQENYADSMLIGLRRILDGSRGSFSLVKLLGKIEQNRAHFTIDRYVRLCASQQARIDGWYAEAMYARFSSDHRTLDRRLIQADVKALLASGSAVLRYTNTFVAHSRDRRRDTTTADLEITLKDLDKLFDEVTALFNKYYGLVRPGVHVDFAPVLPSGFQRAFERMLDGSVRTGVDPTRVNQ
jgi:hypothetical protein